MARGGAKKLHHATIRDAAESVLIDIDAIKYETFKEQVVNCYNELAHQNGYYSKSGAIQNNDWQTLWRRCSSTALLYLREQTDWVKIKQPKHFSKTEKKTLAISEHLSSKRV